MILVIFAAYKHHINVVPTGLIAAQVDERLREYLEDGATWM
ncbi:hypothetical protein [Yaniella halotolerans]|nr:hypothetical protein [Yaniella halotolerans]